MATIIQEPIHAARHFVVVELEHNNSVVPAEGFDVTYNEIVAWCSKNIAGKWYSGKKQQTINTQLQWNKGRFGTEDEKGIAIFNFEDPNDKAHFIIKWM